MPIQNIQATPGFARFSGDPGHLAAAFPVLTQRGPHSSLEAANWAELLGKIERKNERLLRLIRSEPAPAAWLRSGKMRSRVLEQPPAAATALEVIDSPEVEESFAEDSEASHPRVSGPAMLEVLENERARIARELHVGAGQPLAGIKLNLTLLGEHSAGLPAVATEAIDRMKVLADQALDEVRAVSHRLHPPEWQNLSLAQALHRLLETSGLSQRMNVQLLLDENLPEPEHAIKIALYRVTQECFSNISRHSTATSVTLSLTANASSILLQIKDNGAADQNAMKNSRGIGLRSIRDYAVSLDGTASILGGPQGTAVTVTLPLDSIE